MIYTWRSLGAACKQALLGVGEGEEISITLSTPTSQPRFKGFSLPISMGKDLWTRLPTNSTSWPSYSSNSKCLARENTNDGRKMYTKCENIAELIVRKLGSRKGVRCTVLSRLHSVSQVTRQQRLATGENGERLNTRWLFDSLQQRYFVFIWAWVINLTFQTLFLSVGWKFLASFAWCLLNTG